MKALQQSQGWHARLELGFEHALTRTRVAWRRHEGPLLIQKPLYPELAPPDGYGHGEGDGHGSNPCHVYLIHPPGGVASGDHLELNVSLASASHVLLTTPAAGKYYRRGAAGEARMTQNFKVDRAVLEWLPQENIYYPNASVELRSIVNLSSGARFIGWEIGCLGLPACNLSLEAGELRLHFELWNDARPLLLERLAVTRAGLDARWGMAGRTAFGTALFYPASGRELDAAKASAALSNSGTMIACTLVDGVLACRGFGYRTDHLKSAFVALWRNLRPLIVGREAVSPRIWAT
jgi:urease accessory protein